jgi:hypothetical protein
MTRTDLLEAASLKLAEAVLLLIKAGEQHLATSAGELAEIVEFRASAPIALASADIEPA